MWSPDPVIEWLIAEGRMIRAPAELTQGVCERLVAEGAPLWRLRFAPQLANPLLRAWGMVWRRDDGPAREYFVEHAMLLNAAFVGSPFQYTIEHRQPFRRRLVDLDPERDHMALHDVAADGGTDFLALPMLFHSGRPQPISFATDRPSGFDDHDIAGFRRVTDHLVPVIEVMSAVRSQTSLLRTYRGSVPAEAVMAGAVQRGDVRTLEAVVLVTDLRGFTAKSLAWPAERLMQALSAYFEAVCDAVSAHGGDVLKFVGDGVLAIFPVGDDEDPQGPSRAALAAVRQAHAALDQINQRRQAEALERLDFVAALHRGALTYGNIGGADRLDFTVMGSAVNVASRLEGLSKHLGVFGLASAAVAAAADPPLASRGEHTLPGLPAPVQVFEIAV